MDFNFIKEDEVFCVEICVFIEENYFDSFKGKVWCDELECEDFFVWYKVLVDKGWVVLSWLVEWGGMDWIVI